MAAAGLVHVPAAVGLVGSLAALVAAVGGLVKGRHGHVSIATLAGIVLLGFFSALLVGGIQVSSLARSTLLPRIGATVTMELVVTGPIRDASGWQSANARIEGEVANPSGKPAPPGLRGETVSLEIPPPDSGGASADSTTTIEQGQRLEVRGRLMAPAGPSASGFDQATYLRRQGISVVLQAKTGGIEILGRRGGIAGWFDTVRVKARDHLSRSPDARFNEILQGVVMADKQGIDEGWMEAFRRSGTAHMLAVNGLHVGSLAALILVVARRSRLPRAAGFLLAACVAVFMVPFTGGSPSVVRAATMIVIVLLGRWLGRRRDQWQVLAFAAVVVLAPNPMAVFSGGFQLSFAAVAGVLALARPFERLLHRLPRTIASCAAVSLAATVGTAPVSLAVFGQLSLVSALANILVVPLLPLILGLGMASVVLGFLWIGFSAALDTVAAVPLVWTLRVAQVFALVPVLRRQDLGRAFSALLGIAAVLPAVLALTEHTRRLALVFRSSPLRWLRVHRPRSRLLALALAGCLIVGGGLVGLGAYPVASAAAFKVVSLAPGHGWPDCVEVRVLDVGQGNAVLIRTPEHHTFLFDGGPAGCGLAGQLRSLGVNRLDAVLVSHPHADHFAGLLEALGGVSVATFLDDTSVVSAAAPGSAASGTGFPMPGRGSVPPGNGEAATTQASGSKEASDYLELRRILKEKGARYVQAEDGQMIRLDALTVGFYVPAEPVVMIDGDDPWALRGGAPTGDEMNASSVVAVVRDGPIAILLPGDAEADTLAGYHLPRADVIIVPHHGSKGGLSTELLAETGARVACISVGVGNPYGHPASETLRLLQENIGAAYRTDLAGWVAIRLRQTELAVSTERKPEE